MWDMFKLFRSNKTPVPPPPAAPLMGLAAELKNISTNLIEERKSQRIKSETAQAEYKAKAIVSAQTAKQTRLEKTYQVMTSETTRAQLANALRTSVTQEPGMGVFDYTEFLEKILDEHLCNPPYNDTYQDELKLCHQVVIKAINDMFGPGISAMEGTHNYHYEQDSTNGWGADVTHRYAAQRPGIKIKVP